MVRHYVCVAVGSWVVGVLLAAGCAEGRPPAQTPVVTASAPTAASAQPPAVPPARAGTPGRIGCGSETCDLDSQVCCAKSDGSGGHCAPRTEQPCKDDELAKFCDESADCGRGSLCCRTYDCSGGCPAKLDCEEKQCQTEIAEACLPGGKCSPGFSCRLEPGKTEGFCGMDDPGVECGGKRCSGKTPVCRWQFSTASGKCVADVDGNLAAPDDDIAWLGCANAKDCAGYACGKMAEMPLRAFSCATRGFAGDRYFPILCATVADCPKHWGVAASDCAPPEAQQAPAFTRVCVYPEE